MLNEKAPDFELTASTGQKVKLSDCAGSFVVLVFYPANETPVCNSQLSEINVNLDAFLQKNARIFGVNTASAEKHKAYCERRRLQFPILSDPGKKVAKLYGADAWWLPFMPRRTVVAIDPQGTIIFYENAKSDPEKVLEAINQRAAQLA